MTRKKCCLFIIFFLLLAILLPVREGRSEDVTLDIQALTGGKVKEGDTINKDNADLIKDLVNPGVVELVKKGMIIKIGKAWAPWESMPKWYRAETERVHKEVGEPIVDENLVLWTKDHKTWPGGLGFINPKTAAEIVATSFFYHGCDSYQTSFGSMLYVDPSGTAYKNVNQSADSRYVYGRLNEAPLGTVPGMEKEDHRTCITIYNPRELKGLGQLIIRHYDVGKYEDQGFAYLPSFKRVIRVGVTTYQDNQAGSDMTWGDAGGGMYEPQYFFNYKLLGKKAALVPDYYAPWPKILGDKLTCDIGTTWEQGKKYPTLTWRLIEAYQVESTPKVKHVYGKRVQYMADPKYMLAYAGMTSEYDAYDNQMKLWKTIITDGTQNTITPIRGESMAAVRLQGTWDHQTKHSTMLQILPDKLNKAGDPGQLTLKTLIERGK